MNVHDLISRAQDTITVKRVYGEPIEKDGLTIIPAASLSGGGGGGGGPADAGGGAGFGVRARPVGAFVIKDGEVRWEPAIDVTRMALRGMLIPIVGMLVLRSIVKTLARRLG
ncbi:MAG TPA: spore germination protein GerW family protein [Candidatus Limnocylindria bacterium]|nr:spore germination protein GerW family protein [Candidatus Limnocylindria bacterium]